jgi:lysophospholipase L1-like esterase
VRKAAKIIGINLAFLLVVGIVAELIFGGWIGTNYGTLVIPKDFKRRFDVSNLYDPGTPDGMIVYHRDKNGFRGEYDDPSKIDILTIGGSTTNEIFVADGRTWSDMLAKAFAEDGKDVTVVNAGVDGQTTVGNAKNFELWFPLVPKLKAKYVLVYVGINDMALLKTDAMSKQDRMSDSRRSVKQYLINNSVLYSMFRNVRGYIRARDANLIHTHENYDGTNWTLPVTQPDLAALEREWAKELDAFEQRLRDLVAAIRDFGAKPILATQHMGNYRIREGKVYGVPKPDGSVDIADYARLSAVNKRTLQVCEDVGAICIDVANGVRFEDGDNYDGLHTTPQGSEKVGRYMYSRLKDVLSFE